MTDIGKNKDNPELAEQINVLVKSLHQRLRREPDDVKVNAVVRLAVVYLSMSGSTARQAEQLFKSLIAGVDTWTRDN